MQTTRSAESQVQEIMVEPTSIIESNEVVRTVRRRIAGETIRSLIVLEGGRPIGIISQRQLLNVDDDEPIASLMDTSFPMLTPDMTLQEAMERQAAEQDANADYDRVPVVDGSGQIVGEVAREALYHVQRATSAEAVASSPVKQGMNVISADDDKLGSVDDVIFDGDDFTSFTVKHGMLGRKHKRLQADLVNRIDGDKVVVKIGKMEFNMLSDLEDMEAEA